MSNPETELSNPDIDSVDQPLVQERAEDMENAPQIERAIGVTHHPTNFQAQVQDDQGQQLIQTPQNKTITITIPANQTQLTNQSKGNISESVTWYALHWLRMIKMAAFKGWNTVTKGDNNAN